MDSDNECIDIEEFELKPSSIKTATSISPEELSKFIAQQQAIIKYQQSLINQQHQDIELQQSLIDQQHDDIDRCCQAFLKNSNTVQAIQCAPPQPSVGRQSSMNSLASRVAIKTVGLARLTPRRSLSSSSATPRNSKQMLSSRSGHGKTRRASNVSVSTLGSSGQSICNRSVISRASRPALAEIQRMRNQRIAERITSQKAASKYNLVHWDAEQLRAAFLQTIPDAQEFVRQFGSLWKHFLPSSGEELLLLLADNQESSFVSRTERFEAHLKPAQEFCKQQGQNGISLKQKRLLWDKLNALASERHALDLDVFKSLVDCLVSSLKPKKETNASFASNSFASPRLPWNIKEHCADLAFVGSMEDITAFFAITHLRILCRVNPVFPHIVEYDWSVAGPQPTKVPAMLENRQIVASHARSLIEALQRSIEPVLNELLLRAILQLMTNLLADRPMNCSMHLDAAKNEHLLLEMKRQAAQNAKELVEALAVLDRACANVFAPIPPGTSKSPPGSNSKSPPSGDALECKSWMESFNTSLGEHSTGKWKDAGHTDPFLRSTSSRCLSKPLLTPLHNSRAVSSGSAQGIDWQRSFAITHFVYSLCNADTGCIVALANSEFIVLRMTEWLSAEEMRLGWRHLVCIMWLLVCHNDSTVTERVGACIIPVLMERLVDTKCIEGGAPRTEQGVRQKILNCLSMLALIPECAKVLASLEVLEVLQGLVAGNGDEEILEQERSVEILSNLALTLHICSQHTDVSNSEKLLSDAQECLTISTAPDHLAGLNIAEELDALLLRSKGQPFESRVAFEVCRFVCSQVLAKNLDAAFWDARVLQWTCKLDVACANGGVYYEDIPRATLGAFQIQALYQQLLSAHPGVQMFGLFLFAHYSFKVEDQVKLANTTVPLFLTEILYADTFDRKADQTREKDALCFSTDMVFLGHPKQPPQDQLHLSFDESGAPKPHTGGLNLMHAQGKHAHKHICGFQFLLDLLVSDRIDTTQHDSAGKLICLKLMAKGLANLCSNRKNLEKAKTSSILLAFKKLLDVKICRDTVSEREELLEFNLKDPNKYEFSNILDSLSSYAFYRKGALWYHLDRPVAQEFSRGVYTYKVQYNNKYDQLAHFTPDVFRGQCLPCDINLPKEVVDSINYVGKHQGVMEVFACKEGLQLLIETCHAGFPELKVVCLRQFFSMASENMEELLQIDVASSFMDLVAWMLDERQGTHVDTLLSLKALRCVSQKVSFLKKAGTCIPNGWHAFLCEELWKNNALISAVLVCFEGGTSMEQVRKLSIQSMDSENSFQDDEGKLQVEVEISVLALFYHLLQVFDSNIRTNANYLQKLQSKCFSKLRAHVRNVSGDSANVHTRNERDSSRELIAFTQDWRKMLLTVLMQLSYYEELIREVWGTDLEDVLETCRDLIGLSKDVFQQSLLMSPDFAVLRKMQSTSSFAVQSTFELDGPRDASLIEVFTLQHFAVSLVTRLARSKKLKHAVKKTMDIFIKKTEFQLLLEQTLFATFSSPMTSTQEGDLRQQLRLDLLELLLAIMPTVSLRQVLSPRLCYAIGSLCHSESSTLRLAAIKLVKNLANDISFKDVLLSNSEDENLGLELDDQLLQMPPCVPALIKMVRSKDPYEIELGMDTLLQLGQFSKHGLHVISQEGGVAAMVSAANSGLINEKTQAAIATLLQEFSITEEHREQLQKHGGLLLLISYVNDPRVDPISKAQAELACLRFGSEQIELNLALLQQATLLQQTSWVPGNSKSALAAAVGLVHNLQHSTNAERIISKKNFTSLLNLVNSNIPALQLAAIAAFHRVLIHERLGLTKVPLSRKRELAQYTAAICRSTEQVAAHTIQLVLARRLGRSIGEGGYLCQAHIPSRCPPKEKQMIHKMALECLIMICESSLMLAHSLITNGSARHVVLLLSSGSSQVQETALRTLLVLAVSGPNQLRSFSSPVLNLVEMYHLDVHMRLTAREVREQLWGPELHNELRPLRDWKADDASIWLACLGLGDLIPQFQKMIRMAAVVGKWKSIPVATLEGGAGVTKEVLLALDSMSIHTLTNGDEIKKHCLLKALRVVHYLVWMQSRNIDTAARFKNAEENYYWILHEANIHECQRVLEQVSKKKQVYKIMKTPAHFERVKKNVLLNRVEAVDGRGSEKPHSIWIELSTVPGQRVTKSCEEENIVVEKLEEIEDEYHRSHLIVLDEAYTTNEVDRNGMTEIMCRVLNNDIRMVNRLLSTGKISLNIQDKMGCTALHHAIINGWDFCAFLILLAIHTNRAIPDNHVAGDVTTEHVMKLLEEEIINKASQPNATKAATATSFHKSLSSSILTKCLDFKDNRGMTVLHYVLGSHQLAEETQARATRPRPLVLCLARALLAAGADANIADDAGRTALHYVTDGNLKLDQEDFLQCVLHESDPNSQDIYGRTPLHYVVDSNDEKLSLVQQLLQSKAECNIQDKKGQAALHLACLNGHIDVVLLLLKNNTIVSMQDSTGRTSLHLAAQHLHLRVATVLLENAAEVDAQDFLGRTALHYACQFNVHSHESNLSHSQTKILLQQQEALVQLLLRNAADLETADNFGAKPLNFCEVYHNLEGLIEKAVEEQVSFELHAINQPWQIITSLGWRCFSIGKWFRPASWKSAVANDKQPWKAVLSHRESFRRKKEAARASAEMFKDERTQKAVNNEWQHKFRYQEQRRLMLYILFLLVFSGIAILEGGRMKLDGYSVADGLKTIFMQRAFGRNIINLDPDSATFEDIQSPDDWFAWVLGPFNSAFASGEIGYRNGTELAKRAQINTFVKVLGPARFSQWRTRADTCAVRVVQVLPGDLSSCFEEFTEETKDTRPFGVKKNFTYKEKDNFVPCRGLYSQYGIEKGAYTLELPVGNITELEESLQRLQKEEWIDSSTRAVVTELNLYSLTSRRLILAQFLVEFPASGGLATAHAFFYVYNTAQISIHPAEGLDILQLALEFLFCGFVVWLSWVLIRDLMLKRQFFFANSGAFGDILSVLLYVIIIVTRILSVTSAAQINWKETESWMDISELMNVLRYHQFSVSLGLLLAWLKLMGFFANTFERLYILVKMIEMLTGELTGSAVLLVIFCLGFGLSNYAIGSQVQPSQKTVFHSILSMYRNSLGELSFSELEDQTQAMGYYWQSMVLFVFTIIVVIVLFTILVAILTNKYDELRTEAKSKWCCNQAHALHLPKVLQRRNMAQKNARLKQDQRNRKAKGGMESEPMNDLLGLLDSDTLSSVVCLNGLLNFNTSAEESTEKMLVTKLRNLLHNLESIAKAGSNTNSTAALGVFHTLGQSFQIADQLAILVEAEYVKAITVLIRFNNHSTKRGAVAILCLLSREMLKKAKVHKVSLEKSDSKNDALELYKAFERNGVIEQMCNELMVLISLLQNGQKKGEHFREYIPALEVIGNTLWACKAFVKGSAILNASAAFMDVKEKVKQTLFIVNRWAPDWDLKLNGNTERRVDSWTMPTDLVCSFFSDEIIALIMRGTYGTPLDLYIQAVLTLPQMIEALPEAEVRKWIMNHQVIESLCNLLSFEDKKEEHSPSISSTRNALHVRSPLPSPTQQCQSFFEDLHDDRDLELSRDSFASNQPIMQHTKYRVESRTAVKPKLLDRIRLESAHPRVSERSRVGSSCIRVSENSRLEPEQRRFGTAAPELALQCCLQWDLNTRNHARWGAAKSVLLITELLAQKTCIHSFLEEYGSHQRAQSLLYNLFTSVTKMLLAVMERQGVPVAENQQHTLIQLGIQSLNNLAKINSKFNIISELCKRSSLGQDFMSNDFHQLSLQLSQYWMNAMMQLSKSHQLGDVHQLEILPKLPKQKRSFFRSILSRLNLFRYSKLFIRKVSVEQ